MANKNKIVYGDRVFEGNKIKSGNLHLATSLLSSSLEANTLSVVIETEDRTITEFERSAPIVYFYDGVQTGVFYVKSIDRNGPNTYKISATSAIGLLSENQHYGGIYSGETASELLASICGTIPYEIKTNLADIKLYGWLPIATARDNLSQVLFAIGATIRTDLNGVLRIATLWDGISGNLGLDRMYQGPSVTNAAKVTQVIVTEHQYIKSGESSTLFEGATEAGSIITFEEPVFNLSASGFTILESGANYAKLSSGSGRLTGTKYTHNKIQIIRDIVSAKEPNVKKVENATLVSLINSAAVADRMKNYYKHAQSIQAPVVYKGESTGNRVLTWDPYNKEPVTACIEIEDINISNTLKSTSKMLVGYKPPQTEDQTYYDYEDILTGSGDYVIPDEVYSLTVVCIQAGTGGQAGFDGESGGSSQLIVTSKEQNAGGSWSDSPEDGGQGGEKGSPGAGGKAYRATIDVVPGQVIHYECGTPGVGGATNGAVGTAGGETTFGDLSSAQGAVSDTGYTDPVSGDVLAKPGTEGVNGAAGGRGGQASSRRGEYGESGEDVPPNTGGQSGTPYEWSYDNLRSEQVRIYGGGAGGGAALGKNGGPGGGETSGKGAEGGDGASPDPPEAPNKIGTGGNGGHGGGGGGGAGGVFASAEPFEFGGAAGIWITNDGGSAGKGSRGSNGGPGGILVYYQQPKTSESGRFRARGGQLFFGRGRQIFAV
jgi:hypothetical protein|nr:MAG TPA: hypothetical protein [Caudoviricetes sp.]